MEWNPPPWILTLATSRCLSHGGGKGKGRGSGKNTSGYAMMWNRMIQNVEKTNGGSW